jgi:hypothetical protein
MKVASKCLIVLAVPVVLGAQHEHHSDSTNLVRETDAAMSGPRSANASKHLEMSPTRTATHGDSARARDVAERLRSVLARYADTSAAMADGYRMFAPKLKQQRVYHFTNYRNAFKEAFRFDPAQPTSILYRRSANGQLELIGAMYTAPKRMGIDKLDERVPLSIARWHKHVNWCIPRRGQAERWSERKGGQPVFGPESPIATKSACDEAGGMFLASPMGWMIHANVFLGDDLSTVFGHDH